MSVSNTAGKTYDVAEYGRINSVLNEQQDIMDEIDKEKSFQTIKIIIIIFFIIIFIKYPRIYKIGEFIPQ